VWNDKFISSVLDDGNPDHAHYLRPMQPPFRIGYGYDVHRLAEGLPLTLGGVRLESRLGIVAHSDGDVLIHAICDALLGALSLRDIGYHFPDTDAKWKGADSTRLLQHCAQLVREQGYEIGNIDCMLALEAPKINPHNTAMRTGLAEVLGLELHQISIKATTGERMGFVGRQEGVEASAVVLIFHAEVRL